MATEGLPQGHHPCTRKPPSAPTGARQGSRQSPFWVLTGIMGYSSLYDRSHPPSALPCRLSSQRRLRELVAFPGVSRAQSTCEPHSWEAEARKKRSKMVQETITKKILADWILQVKGQSERPWIHPGPFG